MKSEYMRVAVEAFKNMDGSVDIEITFGDQKPVIMEIAAAEDFVLKLKKFIEDTNDSI